MHRQDFDARRVSLLLSNRNDANYLQEKGYINALMAFSNISCGNGIVVRADLYRNRYINGTPVKDSDYYKQRGIKVIPPAPNPFLKGESMYKFGDFVSGRIVLEIPTPNDAALLIQKIGEYDPYKRCSHIITPGKIIRYSPCDKFVSFNNINENTIDWYQDHWLELGVPQGYLVRKRLRNVCNITLPLSGERRDRYW